MACLPIFSCHPTRLSDPFHSTELETRFGLLDDEAEADGGRADAGEGAGHRSNGHALLSRIGTKVEVLAADEGLRGCWFAATVIAARTDKIRVRCASSKVASCHIRRTLRRKPYTWHSI